LVKLEMLHPPFGLHLWTQQIMTEKLNAWFDAKAALASPVPITWPSRLADTVFR
jgi:hypothetical protein